MNKKILLIDSHNMLHRAKHTPGLGNHKNYYLFFRMLSSEMKLHAPDVVYIVDEGHPQKSLDLQSDYKANRQHLPDDQFKREKKEVFDTIKKMSGLTYIKHPHYECDDVIGFLANDIHKHDDVTIVSSDTDFIQCITDNVKVWNPIKKKFLEKWPVDYVTWKALKGDPTDNVPGVSGVGAVTANKLSSDRIKLLKFLTEKPERLVQFETCVKIIKLKEVVPVDQLEIVQEDFNQEKLLTEFSNRDFKSITEKWEKWIVPFQKSGGKNAFK